MIELLNFGKNTVAHKSINEYSPAVKQHIVCFLGVQFDMISDNNIVQYGFQITQLDFNHCAVVFLDKFLNFRFIGDVYVIDDYFFDATVQVRNRLMNNAVHRDLIKQL